MTLGNRCLLLGGLGVFVGAGVHVAALAASPQWIEFVGAPSSVVRSAMEGTWLAPAGALGIAALLIVWGLYETFAVTASAVVFALGAAYAVGFWGVWRSERDTVVPCSDASA